MIEHPNATYSLRQSKTSLGLFILSLFTFFLFFATTAWALVILSFILVILSVVMAINSFSLAKEGRKVLRLKPAEYSGDAKFKTVYFISGSVILISIAATVTAIVILAGVMNGMTMF